MWSVLTSIPRRKDMSLRDMMDICAKPGSKVVFANPDAGYLDDQKRAKKHLTEGAIYTVENVVVDRYSSVVFLTEIPGVAFNTVLFRDK
jgi:hypothetical protein